MNSNLNPSAEFDPGQIVFLKADPSLRWKWEQATLF